jgi:hypothetical protein
MCAFTAFISENLFLSTGGPGWQVLRASDRQAEGGFSTLAGQKMDEWGWISVNVDILATLIFCRALCYGIRALVP